MVWSATPLATFRLGILDDDSCIALYLYQLLGHTMRYFLLCYRLEKAYRSSFVGVDVPQWHYKVRGVDIISSR